MKTRFLLLAAAAAGLGAEAGGGGDDASAAGGGGAVQDPGTIDNRLSLDPSDDRWKGYVDEWEDGKSYTVTAKITQISPGEFEVVEIEDAKPADAAEEAKPGEDAAEAAPSEISTTSDNPAIKNLMKE